MRITYLEPCQHRELPTPLRTGAAGRAIFGTQGALEIEHCLALSANATHALLGHGVVERLNAIELEGEVGNGRDVMIPPSKSDAVLDVFYDADRMTYGAEYEFVVARQAGQECEGPTEFRIRIDNREYQRVLSRLQFLVSSASREGAFVWIRI